MSWNVRQCVFAWCKDVCLLRCFLISAAICQRGHALVHALWSERPAKLIKIQLTIDLFTEQDSWDVHLWSILYTNVMLRSMFVIVHRSNTHLWRITLIWQVMLMPEGGYCTCLTARRSGGWAPAVADGFSLWICPVCMKFFKTAVKTVVECS